MAVVVIIAIFLAYVGPLASAASPTLEQFRGTAWKAKKKKRNVIIIASVLSAVGAVALLAGALALRRHLRHGKLGGSPEAKPLSPHSSEESRMTHPGKGDDRLITKVRGQSPLEGERSQESPPGHLLGHADKEIEDERDSRPANRSILPPDDAVPALDWDRSYDPYTPAGAAGGDGDSNGDFGNRPPVFTGSDLPWLESPYPGGVDWNEGKSSSFQSLPGSGTEADLEVQDEAPLSTPTAMTPPGSRGSTPPPAVSADSGNSFKDFLALQGVPTTNV